MRAAQTEGGRDAAYMGAGLRRLRFIFFFARTQRRLKEYEKTKRKKYHVREFGDVWADWNFQNCAALEALRSNAIWQNSE